jgi:hypothetical protein
MLLAGCSRCIIRWDSGPYSSQSERAQFIRHL